MQGVVYQLSADRYVVPGLTHRNRMAPNRDIQAPLDEELVRLTRQLAGNVDSDEQVKRQQSIAETASLIVARGDFDDSGDFILPSLEFWSHQIKTIEFEYLQGKIIEVDGKKYELVGTGGSGKYRRLVLAQCAPLHARQKLLVIDPTSIHNDQAVMQLGQEPTRVRLPRVADRIVPKDEVAFPSKEGRKKRRSPRSSDAIRATGLSKDHPANRLDTLWQARASKEEVAAIEAWRAANGLSKKDATRYAFALAQSQPVDPNILKKLEID